MLDELNGQAVKRQRVAQDSKESDKDADKDAGASETDEWLLLLESDGYFLGSSQFRH